VPIRSVEAGALHEAIRRLASRPRLEAVRELAAELDRLDQDTASCEAASQGNLASSGFRSSDEVR
jgi:hypothetical protein